MDNILEVLKKLIPLAAPVTPGAGAAPEIVAAVAALIQQIQQQNNKTPDEILAEAGVTLDANDKMLLTDAALLGDPTTKSDR